MGLAALAILVGFALLVWSADRFVEGAAVSARYVGMPSLLIGMVVVGFGTSTPEMLVSAMAAIDGNPDLALGNAVGSNIVNIGLILGITALIAPIAVHSDVVRRELPVLIIVSLFAGLLFWNGALTRVESYLLLLGFVGLLGWTIFTALRNRNDPLKKDIDSAFSGPTMPLGKAVFWMVIGLLLLLVSSRLLVWGAVTVAHSLGVSDLIIGLTIVALGTSLPELASSVMAARKGEHDIALGNIVGSNLFNILAVVGVAGAIRSMNDLAPEVFTRDWVAMMVLTVVLLITAFGFRGAGRINRIEGAGLIVLFVGYNVWLVTSI